MPLSSTILRLQEIDRARDEREAELDRPRLVESWRRDIEEVYDVIRAALRPYAENGSAVFEDDEVEVTEAILGANSYPRMTIEIVGRRIVVAPVARFPIGGSGRLDIYRENRPSEEHRILILRGIVVLDHDPELWLIEQKGEAMTGPPGSHHVIQRGSRRYRLLEPLSVETAVDYLLMLP